MCRSKANGGRRCSGSNNHKGVTTSNNEITPPAQTISELTTKETLEIVNNYFSSPEQLNDIASSDDPELWALQIIQNPATSYSTLADLTTRLSPQRSPFQFGFAMEELQRRGQHLDLLRRGDLMEIESFLDEQMTDDRNAPLSHEVVEQAVFFLSSNDSYRPVEMYDFLQKLLSVSLLSPNPKMETFQSIENIFAKLPAPETEKKILRLRVSPKQYFPHASGGNKLPPTFSDAMKPLSDKLRKQKHQKFSDEVPDFSSLPKEWQEMMIDTKWSGS